MTEEGTFTGHDVEEAYWARRVAEAEASGIVSWDVAVAALETASTTTGWWSS